MSKETLDITVARHCLAPNKVHVWLAHLDSESAAEPSTARELLSADELVRASRFARERDAVRWTRSRSLLRLLLGRYLGDDPASLRFVTGRHGKPLLASGPELHFNLSHSGAFALYAVARDQPVGVDLETLGRHLSSLAFARRAFGLETRRRLEALDGDERDRELLRMWVRHEAILKCTGAGLTGDPDAEGGPLWTTEIDAGDGLLAALATRRKPADIEYSSVTSALEPIDPGAQP